MSTTTLSLVLAPRIAPVPEQSDAGQVVGPNPAEV
jgi:hypothetical protein